MNKIILLSLFLLSLVSVSISAKEYHVSPKGNDSNTGTEAAPLLTISAAAKVAVAGDIINIHAGTYREWINPANGGESDSKRIVYRAAHGQKVEVKGSEIIKNWKKVADGVWKVEIPNSFFGNYNPYKDEIFGDWFDKLGRVHHTGEVYLNGKSLYEKANLADVMKPMAKADALDPHGELYGWYCEVNETTTSIWANFHKANPNKDLVEINVRNTCFYPEKQGINYISIEGIHFSQAATQWGAPTAHQVGMIATHWNKGWVIENNVISDSKCSGITLGKEADTGHNVWSYDMTKNGSVHYIEVTFKTLRNGWNKEKIGSHIVRNNTIFNCEQTGICGSMGAAFSTIENNLIYNIWTKRQFIGWEIAGVKFHGAVDTQIRNNTIHHTGRGLWLDWMTQGTRVTQNLFYSNDIEDIYTEVSHGPYMVDNNILASPVSYHDQSHGCAFIHNLYGGKIHLRNEPERYTPYLLPHSTDMAGFSIIEGGDNRYFNNLFAPITITDHSKSSGAYGLAAYDSVPLPMMVDGNVYTNGAKKYGKEENYLSKEQIDTKLEIVDRNGKTYLIINMPEGLSSVKTKLVNSDRLGKAKFPDLPFETPHGEKINFDTDYFGNKRGTQPTPGPFESLKEGENTIQLK